MSEYSKYTLEELIELKKKINQYINDYTDGYFYACNTLKYGHRSHHIYNNFEMARKVFLSYNGDNGFCDLYTNNPKILEIYSGGGDLYYIENEELFQKEMSGYGSYSKFYNSEEMKNVLRSRKIERILYDHKQIQTDFFF